MDKMIIKSGKYTTECLRKTEFVTNQSWMKLMKCSLLQMFKQIFAEAK